MKKRKSICTYLLILVMALTSILLPVSVDAAAKIKISKTKVTLEAGKSITLKITGTKKKVTWRTSNKANVTVSNKGKITAKKVGKATITATVNKKKYTCKVTVTTNKSDEKESEEDKEETNASAGKVLKDSNGYWKVADGGEDIVWSGTNSTKSGTIGKFSWKVGTGIRVNGYTIYSMPWAEDYEGEIEDIGYDVDNAIKRYNIPSASNMSGKECAKWIIDNYDLINSRKNEYGFCIAAQAINDKSSSDIPSKDELVEMGWSKTYGELQTSLNSNFKNGTSHNKY